MSTMSEVGPFRVHRRSTWSLDRVDNHIYYATMRIPPTPALAEYMYDMALEPRGQKTLENRDSLRTAAFDELTELAVAVGAPLR